MLKYCKTISEIISRFLPPRFASMLAYDKETGKVKIEEQSSTSVGFVK